MGTFGDIFSVSAVIGKTMPQTWLFLFVAVTSNSQIIKKVKKMIECSIGNFVSVYAVTEQKTAPSIASSSPKRDFEREKEVEDTMLDLVKPFTEGLKEQDASSLTPTLGALPKHEVVEEKPLDDKLPSVVTDAERDTLAKDTKSKKGIIGSQSTMRSLIIRKIPLVNDPDGIAPSTKFRTLDHCR